MRNILTLLVIIVLVFVVLYVLQRYSNPIKNEGEVSVSNAPMNLDGAMADPREKPEHMGSRGDQEVGTRAANYEDNELVGRPVSQDSDEMATTAELRAATCFPKDQLTPAELLPKSDDTDPLSFSKLYPTGNNTLKDKNFLQAGWCYGLNTVGQTLRNANLQLRSEPPNPQVAVSIWNQSTIEPDTQRRPLEIGGCS